MTVHDGAKVAHHTGFYCWIIFITSLPLSLHVMDANLSKDERVELVLARGRPGTCNPSFTTGFGERKNPEVHLALEVELISSKKHRLRNARPER